MAKPEQSIDDSKVIRSQDPHDWAVRIMRKPNCESLGPSCDLIFWIGIIDNDESTRNGAESTHSQPFSQYLFCIGLKHFNSVSDRRRQLFREAQYCVLVYDESVFQCAVIITSEIHQRSMYISIFSCRIACCKLPGVETWNARLFY